jgi:hypothetical protein
MRCAAVSTDRGAVHDDAGGFDPRYGAWTVPARLSGRASYETIEGMKNEHDREPTPDETAGMVWWNSLTEADRTAWLARAGSAVPADAWVAYKRLGDVDRQPRIIN